jgi:hypothetical protein
MDVAGTGYNNLVGSDFPRDVLVIDSESQLVNETFEKAILEDGLYNHHITYTDSSKKATPWLACDGKPVAELSGSFFMGAGSEDIRDKYSPANGKSVKYGFVFPV